MAKERPVFTSMLWMEVSEFFLNPRRVLFDGKDISIVLNPNWILDSHESNEPGLNRRLHVLFSFEF